MSYCELLDPQEYILRHWTLGTGCLPRSPPALRRWGSMWGFFCAALCDLRVLSSLTRDISQAPSSGTAAS